MKKISIREAAQKCGFKLKDFEKLLALPVDNPRRPKSLMLVDPEHLDSEGVDRYIQLSEARQLPAKVLDDEQLFLVLQQAGRMRNGIRNQALIALSNYGGLRSVEISRLTILDVVEGSGVLKYETTLKRGRTKNKEARRIFFHNETLRRYMQAHINDRLNRQQVPLTAPLFSPVSQPTEPYKRNTLTKLFEWIYKRCDQPGFSSHSGRRRVATKIIKSEGLKAAQLIMGHKNSATTAIYGEYSDNELAAIQRGL